MTQAIRLWAFGWITAFRGAASSRRTWRPAPAAPRQYRADAPMCCQGASDVAGRPV